MHADDDTALRAACQNGGADVAEVLLKAGADVHAKDDVVQRAACRERHVRIVGLLLDAVADVHADNDSEDALRAASKDHVAVVELLPWHGATPDLDSIRRSNTLATRGTSPWSICCSLRARTCTRTTCSH